jgi:hypothetical protein
MRSRRLPRRSRWSCDGDTIDSQLRLIAAVRRTIRDPGGPMPTTGPMDELLDERLAHGPRSPADARTVEPRRARDDERVTR